MKILYVCFAIDQETTSKYQITSDSPAAFVKVKSVCDAIKTTGNEVSILSMGIFNSKVTVKYLEDKIVDGINIKYIHNKGTKGLRNFYTLFVLPSYIKKENPDVVIFYNYSFEYFRAVNYCKRAGVKFIIDIEDGVNKELNYLQYKFRKRVYRNFIIKAKGNVFTVCKALTQDDVVKNSLIIYGTGRSVEKNKKDYNSDKISFLFCGTIIKETGAEYIITALKKLSMMNDINSKVFINICGFGNYDNQLKDLSEKYSSFVKFHGKVDRQSYTDLLDKSDCAFVLRVAESSMAQTTFPSKVVELSLNNLGLITTPASDIPLLFTEEEVFFVNNEDEIISSIREIISNPQLFIEKREKLFKKACDNFDMKSIGKNIIDFIERM